MRLISLEEMKEIDNLRNSTEGRLISLEEMDAIQGGKPPLPAPSEGSYVSPAGAAFVPPRSGKRAVQPEQPKAAPVIPPPSDQPEMRAYEPTIWERLKDLLPQNRAAAANEYAARKMAEERKIPVNEAYRQMQEAVGVKGILGGGPWGQPLWNPEGRSPIPTAVTTIPYAVESVLDATKGVVEAALTMYRAGDIAKPYDSGLVDRVITYLGDDANDIFIPNLPKKLGLDPKEPNYKPIAEFGRSLGMSLMSIVPQAIAGSAATAVTGNPIAGVGAGLAVGATTSYLSSYDEFMVNLRDKLNSESKKIFGRPMDEKEWNAAKEKYKNLAREYSGWETVPETLANAIFLKAFAAPLKSATKATLKQYLAIGASIGSEHVTETITGLGKNSVELRAGLTDDELTVVDAFKQQFIQTMLTMGVMAGGVKAIQAGNRFYNTQVLPHINPDSALAKAIKADIDLVALKQAAPLRTLNEANIKGSKQVAPSEAYAAPTPSPAKPSPTIAMPSGNAPKPAASDEEDEQVPGMPSDDEIEEDTEDATRLTPVSLATQTPAAAALPVTPTVAPISGKPPADPPPGNLEVNGLPTQEIPLSSLKLSKDVPQFKLGATSEGVVEPLGGKFERTGVAPIQVWQRLDGTLEVISGRHRVDLAKRSGEETIPAQVHSEAQGFGQKQAAILDAELNKKAERGVPAPKTIPVSEEEAPVTKPSSAQGQTLPRELAGAKPRYSYGDKQFELTFESDVDKAAYIASQPRPSKRDADYVQFVMDATGLSEEEVRAYGQIVRGNIKATAKTAEPGMLTVPATVPKKDLVLTQPSIAELNEKAERGVPAPKTIPVSEEEAPVTKPSSAQGQTLPRELAGAKPRYSYGDKQFELTFESDVDKAAYIASQPRPSKRDADYVQFVMDATGLSEEEVRAYGQIVRDNIKATAKTAEPGMLTVPATVPKKDLVLTQPSIAELNKKAEREDAEAKRLKEEQEAAERKAKADRETKSFTLTGSDQPADIAIAHGQQELVPAESGVEAEDAVSTSQLPKSISEAIENDLKRQKRFIAQAKKDSQNPDLTLRQRADASQAYNSANGVLQRMRTNIFQAEDAAADALKNKDAKAFEDYAKLFPKAAIEIEKSIAATETDLLNQETQGEENEPTKLGESGTGELEGAQPKTVQGTGEGEKTGDGTTGGGGEDVSGGVGTGGQRSKSSGRMGDDEGEISADKAGTKKREIQVGGTGTNQRSDRTQQPDIEDAQSGGNPGLKPASGTRSQDRADDFIITDADEIGEGGAKTKYKQNIAAIRLLKQLSAERRQATREEQAVLAKYVGWGGIPQAFYRDNNEVSKGWEKEAKELKELLTPEELEAAAASTRNAHYTSTEIVSAMWDAIKHFGYQGGRVLEPSVGVGNFFGMMPTGLRKASQLTGVELDHITGGIAKQLYPQANIAAPVGFQDFSAPDNYFDLAIGNPPFGQEGIYDSSNRKISGFSIHNYFFAKSLNTVRPNGVLAMVVTNRLLDSVGDKARAYIAERAQFLGAIRLPNDAFAKNAGTQVTTDIIFLRKLKDGEEPTGQKWMDARQYTDKNGKTVLLNEYFIRNPDMMLGDFGQFGSMYSAEDAALVAREGQDTPALLKDAIKKLPGKFMDPPTAAPVLETVEPMNDVSHVKIGSMFEQDGKIFVRKPDLLNKQQAFPVEFASGMAEKRVRGMIGARDAFITVRGMQLDENADEKKLEQARKKLNETYDAFVADYGLINTDVNKRLMRDDPTWPQMSALEEGYDKGLSATAAKQTGNKARPPSAKKADIFTKRTQTPYKRPDKASSAKDAMLISMAEYGGLNLDYMASIYGKTRSAIISELDGLIYLNPQGGWESKDQYLSGNVKKKLAQAIEAAKTNPNMEANVEALKAVQPTDIEAIDIDVKIGSPWLPADVMQDFVLHITQALEPEAVYNPINATWTLSARNIPSSVGAQWGTERSRVMEVLKAAANHKQIVITNTMGDGTSVRDIPATAAANEKVNEVKEEWKRWVWADDNRRARLHRIYNDTFNTDVLQQFDGEFLKLPGKVGDDVIKLRPHQLNFVWRGLQSGVVLADHVVGAGKTFSLIALAMEKRRIGQAKKPMLVVPNHLVGQWAADFAKLYPNANILATTKNDFLGDNRKKLFARIATGDWDAVIVAHSSFGKVEVSPEYQSQFIETQIEDCVSSIQAMRNLEGKKSRNVKQIQKQKASLEEKLKKLLDTGSKDDNLTFEELGVDALFVDEFHEFKNLAFSTSMKVSGLGNPTGSLKATDMFLKVQSILKSTGGKNIVAATGTPVSNTMAEMYTMQRYLDYQSLKDQGISHFDAWARTFGEVVTDWELSPSGQYKMSSKFSKFVNLPELMMRYQSFADVINRDDINKQLAARGETLPIPKIKGGKPENVVVNRSSDQAEYIGVPRVDKNGRETYPETSLIWRSENLPKKAEKGADNMLKIMSDARKAALDMRLIEPSFGDNSLSKVNVAAENILHIYKKWDSVKGTQLVFCDLSTPKSSVSKEKAELKELIALAEEGNEDAQEKLDNMSPDDLMALDGEFSVYDDLKEKLIALGIPANEIAFIHDANTDIRKEEMFAKVRSGMVRVLLGSTSKMGAGMNVQERLVALHHLDAPWRPSDLEQREGRIIRQGNKLFDKDPQGFEIEILRYATKQTLDSRMWQTLETKARFIEQVRKGTGERQAEDIGGEAANSAEMKAASSGNPLILEEMTLRKTIRDLETQRYNHERSQHRIKDLIRTKKDHIKSLEKKAETMGKDVDLAPKKFAATIYGKTYERQGEIGAAILDAAKKMRTDKKDSVEIGSYGGYKLIIDDASTKLGGIQAILTIKGKEEYQIDANPDASDVGLGIRLRNAVPDLQKINDVRSEIKEEKDEVVKLESQAAPWDKESELQAVKGRHAAIIEELKPKTKSEEKPVDGADIPLANIDVDLMGKPAISETNEFAKRTKEEIRQETINQYKELRAKLGRLPTQIAKGEVGLDLQKTVTELLQQTRELKREIEATKPRRDSAEVFLAKALTEYSNGNISKEVLDVVQAAYQKEPALLEGLQLSVVKPEKNGKANARFDPIDRIVALFKETTGVVNPATIRHELTHSLEQMMTPDQQMVVVQSWLKAINQAIKKYPEEKHQDYFRAVLNFFNEPNDINYQAALDLLPNYEMYQFLNPSEYWAINAEKLLAAEIGAAWDKFKRAVRQLWEGLKKVFGFDNRYDVHKVFNQVMGGGMERINYSSIVQGAVENISGYSTTLADIQPATKFWEDIPNEEWLEGKIKTATQSPRNEFGVPRMGVVTGYFSGPVYVPTKWFSDVKGESGEQQNVRTKTLAGIRKVIRETGRFPIMEGSEYVPFIRIGFDGMPWISEGNHRIMAALEEGIEYIPIEIRYFDGGQRRADKWQPNNLIDIQSSKNVVAAVEGRDAAKRSQTFDVPLLDIDDEKLLKKYSRPNTPTTSDETIKSLAVDSAVKAKKIFKDAVKDPKGEAAKVGNTLTDAILEARNQAVFYGAGLEARDFARYGGELRTAQELVTASVALDNAIRSGNIAQEVLFRGGIRYNPASGMYEAVQTKKGMHGVYEAQKKLLDKLGKQVGTDIIQGYLEAKRSISITNEYLDRESKYQGALAAYESALQTGKDLQLIESFKMLADSLQKDVEQIKKALSSVNMSDEEMYEFAALEDKHTELRDIMDNWTAVSQNLLKMWKDVKLIPKERYNSLSEIKDYVPWYRIMDDGLDMHDPDQSAPKTTTRAMTNIGREKLFKRGKPTAVIDFRAKAGQKEFKIQPSSSVEVEVNDVPVPQSKLSVTADGKVTINLPLKANDLVVIKTHREIQNIIDNMTNNVMRMTINGLRQYAANRIVMEYASRNQKGKVMLFPKEDRNKGRFAWMLNGKKVFVEIQDPLVVQAIYGMENMNLKMFAPMAAVANLTRRTITLSPAFQVAQVFKDAPTAALVTGVKNPMALIGGVWKGFITSLTGTEPVAEILKAAGIGGYYSPARTADDEVKRRLGVMNGNVYDKFIRALDHISDASDMAQRVAVYKRVMAETNDEMLAKYQAANVFNQMRHGASPYAQLFTRTIPFANAYAVTIDKLAQTLMGGGLKGMDRKKALARLGVCASMLAGISLLYAMAVGGDPEYEELDDQTKLKNFMIPGTKIMLPMNTAAAYFFKAIPELVYNHITKKGTENEYDARRLRQALSGVALDALSGPTPIPIAIKPLLEVSVDYSFFTGRSIVPPNLKNVEAAEQYTGSTSELGKAISAALEIPGTDGKRVLNPIEADHIVRGLFGTVGAMTQWVTNSIGSIAETRPEPSGRENPFIGTFLREEVPRGKEDLYYDLKGVVDTKYQTWKKMMERGAYEEADAFLDKNDAAISMHDYIRDTDAELKDINSEIRQLGESKDQNLSPKERRKEIDEYKRMKNEILDPVKDMRREIFK